MELKNLCGKHILSGIETGTAEKERYGCKETNNYVKFCLDGVCYIAFENPDDGYRSYCDELEITNIPCKFSISNVEVLGKMRDNEKCENHDILSLIDTITGKEVLAVGTANHDDWYPYCVIEWYPENLSCNSDFGEK